VKLRPRFIPACGLAVGVSTLVLARSLAVADPDLALHHEPAALRMRPKKAKPNKNATPAVAQTTVASAAPRGAAGGDAQTSAPGGNAPPTTGAAAAGMPTSATDFTALPTSVRDLAERVIVRVRAGYELDNAPASGQPFLGGDPLPPNFAGSRSWILGDAVVGAKDILLPSLGAYLLSSFQFDTSGALPTRTALVVPGDATGERVVMQAGYAEYGTDGKDPDQHLWLRAGRQFRLDGGAMFAYYDGGTIGWKEPAWNVSAFAGQRVALYVDTPTGLEVGATASADVQRLVHLSFPLKVAADFQGLDVTNQFRSLAAMSMSSDPSRALHLDVRVRAVDSGDGLGFGRADARLRWAPRRDLVVVADVEQRSGDDVAYDLATPSAVDVVSIAKQLGVGLAAPIDATTVGARIDFRRGPVELLVFSRVEIPEATVTNVAQQGWLEVGGAFATLIEGAWTTAQYTLRQYFLDASANAIGTAFDDTGATGITRMHEVAVDTTLRAPGSLGRHWRFGGGVFYRLYDEQTPYEVINNDGRFGGRVNLQWWYSRELHIELAGDAAQSDPIIQQQLGVMTSVRMVAEARW
jgi:hypothetical protein